MAVIDLDQAAPETENIRYATSLLARRHLSPNTCELTLVKPQGYSFAAGQHLTLSAVTLERIYTIVSGPADPHLCLIIREFETGGMSQYLLQTDIGSSMTISKASGYFTFKPSVRKPVFVATGTGIAPFVAMARAGITGFTLLHGVRTAQECYYVMELQKASAAYIPCLSQDIAGAGTSFSGRVTSYLTEHLAVARYDFYLCGRSEMIRDATLLIDNRFAGSRVYSERFY